MTLINRFDGGLSEKIDPTLIKHNYSPVVINADISTGVLKSEKKASSKIEKGALSFMGDKCWYYVPLIKSSNLEWIYAKDTTFLDYKDYVYYKSHTYIYNKYGTTRGPLAKRILQSKSLRRVLEGLISPSKRRLFKEKLLLKEETKPEIDKKDRMFLVNYYSENVLKIKKLIERDLPWKNFS